MEVAAGADLHKYNPFSNFTGYTGAAAVWTSLRANETQPQCPPVAVSDDDNITIVRSHMDAYLLYALNKRAEMSAFNSDNDFFAFPSHIVPSSDWSYNLAGTYDNAVMIIYLLARADDETHFNRAACYLQAAADVASTFLRLMEASGYNATLDSPELRLGTFEGLFAYYPAAAAGFIAPGDLGNNTCEPNCILGL